MSDNPFDVKLPLDEGTHALLENVVWQLKQAVSHIITQVDGHFQAGLDLIALAVCDIEEVIDDDF